ncbi:IS110 family transposase [Nocardia sputi]|uniref:IS110 family transposase n=1 Tax=Nocardia sputi TaxID=2943705 RepID=UPI0035568BE7
MAVAGYRERHTMARSKSDHADAMTLADILRVDAHMHRPVPAHTELTQDIAMLARAQQDAVWRRTKASNELRSLLREYHPMFLAACGERVHKPPQTRGPRWPGHRGDPSPRSETHPGPRRRHAAPGWLQTRHRRPGRRHRCQTAPSWPAPARPGREGYGPSGLPLLATLDAASTGADDSSRPPPKSSANTLITRSSPVSPAWQTSPAPASSPKSATTEPVRRRRGRCTVARACRCRNRLVAAGLFPRRQRRLAEPLVDVALFRTPAFSAAIVMLVLGLAAVARRPGCGDAGLAQSGAAARAT